MHSFRLHKDGRHSFISWACADAPEPAQGDGLEQRAAEALDAQPRPRLGAPRADAQGERLPCQELLHAVKQTAPSQPQGDDQHQGLPPSLSEVVASAPPPPPQALPATAHAVAAAGAEQMDAREREAERAESSSVAVVSPASSTATPKAKRTLLPPGLPPPILLHHHLSTSSPPPPTRGRESPDTRTPRNASCTCRGARESLSSSEIYVYSAHYGIWITQYD